MLCKLLFHAVHVASVTCVDLYEVALVDEQRHAYLSTSLQSSWLGSVGSSVALHAWLRVSHTQVGLHWHLSVEDSVGIGIAYNLHNVALLHEVHASDKILCDGHLVVCLLVHEDVVSSVEVKILVWAALYAYILQSLTDVEALLQNASADNVLQCGTHDSVTLTWLYVQEVNTEIQLAIHADASTFLDVL